MSVRVGVVGLGQIHHIHCWSADLASGAELGGVYDIVPERAKEVAAERNTYAASSLQDLFDRVDAISVCVPSGLHAEIGIAAAKAGKHVLCEKPIDITLKAATELVDICEAAGVKLGVISQHRLSRDIVAAKAAVDSGELGRMVFGEAATKWLRTQEYYDSGDWRGTWELDGGGCLMNQGVHYVDMLQWVMGGVAAVRAITKTLTHDIEVEDCAAAVLEFKSGAIGTLRGSTSCYPGVAESLEVHGDKGSVLIEADKIRAWKTVAQENGEPSAMPTGEVEKVKLSESAAADPAAAWGEQHLHQMQDFVDSIRDDRDPMVTGRAALEPLKVILAIYESGRNGGKRVEL
jgi:predicted dehydrogenase